MKIKFMILILGTLLSGCITTSYHVSTEEYGNARREFDTKSETGIRIFKGIFAGEREIRGEKYYCLQFDDVLKGKGRYLDVMLSLKGKLSPSIVVGPDGNLVETKTMIQRPGDLFFIESDKGTTGNQPAYLIFQVYSSQDLNSFYALFNQKVGDVSDPTAILKEHFGVVIKEPQYPFVLVKLDFVINYAYSARALVWGKGPGGRTKVLCEGLDQDKYNGPRFSIEWNERSRLMYGLRQGGYIGTVIADIVTSPVQLVYLLLVAMGGGVR